MVALSNLLGSYEKGILHMSKILGVAGRILPVTKNIVNLVAEYEDGEIVEGESLIDFPPKTHNGKQRITKLSINPEEPVNPEAQLAILEADLIVIGPGDLYTSLIANLTVPGVSVALKKTKAKIVYVMNLVTKYGQTYDFTAKDHVEEFKKYAGRHADYVVLNSEKLPERVLKSYKEENDFPVKDDLNSEEYEVVRADLLMPREIKRSSGDVVKRSLIRHDPDKVAWEIFKVLKMN